MLQKGVIGSTGGKRGHDQEDEPQVDDEDEDIEIDVEESDSRPPSRASSYKSSRSKGGPSKRDTFSVADVAEVTNFVYVAELGEWGD